MSSRRAYTIVEVVVAMALGLTTLAIVLRLGTLFRGPTDHRERVREASIGLALALERIVRSVRDASNVDEAAGSTLLLRMPEGGADLWQYRPAQGGGGGELVLIEDVSPPGPAGQPGRPPVETTIAHGLTRCVFTPPAASLPQLLPGLSSAPHPERVVVECLLETMVDGTAVRERTTASCRNTSWEVLWR